MRKLHGPLPAELGTAFSQAIRTNVSSQMVFLDDEPEGFHLDSRGVQVLIEQARQGAKLGSQLIPLLRHEDDGTFTLVHGLELLIGAALHARTDSLTLAAAVMYPDPVPKMPKVTPTQELILEVLAARFRAGDNNFTFSTRTRGAAEEVEQMGLIHVMGGQVEKTYRASLTWTGLFTMLMPGYKPYESSSPRVFGAPPIDQKASIEAMLERMQGPSADWRQHAWNLDIL